MTDLTGKPIAITGASSGIGKATAILCAKAGMPVALAARREDKLAEVAHQITAFGCRAITIPCDVTNPQDCQTLIDRTVAEFGSIHAIFANAGYGVERAVHNTTDDQLRTLFETNFFGSLNAIRPAIPHMQRAHAGHILLCSSSIGKIGIPYYGPYCATKGAQSLIAQAMRHELKPSGIEVSTVYPVLTETEFGKVAREHTGHMRIADQARFNVQTADEVARSIVRCLRKPRPEVWTSLSTRWAIALSCALPGLTDTVLARVARKVDARKP